MNNVKSNKSFIFINVLPVEIEEYILNYYFENRKRDKENLQLLYSNDDLVNELYRRCKGDPCENNIPIIPCNLVHSDNSTIPRLPLGYLRDIYRYITQQ